MKRNVFALGVLLILACISEGVKSHQTRQNSIKIGSKKSGRTLLHTLPVTSELQNLQSTLGALTNADGRRADLLLHKAAGEAWNAAQIVADPLIEATSPVFAARRKLQQLAQVAPLGSPELNAWLKSAGEFWQARAQQDQSLSPLAVASNTATAQKTSTASSPPTFPGGFDFGNLQLPQLSPEALKSVTQFLNSTAQSFLLTRAIGGMMDQTITDVSQSFSKYRIKAPSTGPSGSSTVNTRRLQQAVHDKETHNSESSAVEVTAADVLKALQQLQIATAVGGIDGPVNSVDLQFSDNTKEHATSLKRRLLSSANGDINAFATQLQQQVKDAVDTWQKLDNGAVISSDEVKTYLASRAAGLKQRFEKLKTKFDTAAAAATATAKTTTGSTKRRLLEENGNFASAAAPPSEEEEEIFDRFYPSPAAYSTSTVLLLMTPADAEASTAFIDDVLNFLMDTLTASRITPTTDAFGSGSGFRLPQALGLGVPMYRPDESDDVYCKEMYADFPAAEEEENNNDRRRRRQLLGSSASSAASYDQEYKDEDDFLDNEYAQEEAWLWVAGDDDWMRPEASIEEAVLQYADEANESELLDLVVKLVAPIDKNGEGISPALLDILLDPANASVAQLLKELAAGPAGGDISVAKQSDTVLPPRFAVFGPSVASGFSQAAAVGAHLPRPQTQQRDSNNNNNNGKMVDMVVAPLRGPKPHTERDMPSGIDARWWGVVLGLGGLGLLLVGAAAVAAMKSPSPEFSQVPTGEDSIHGGGSGGRGEAVKGGYESVPSSPQRSTSPWENKGQVAKVKASSGTSRKTSNLPA